MGEVKAEKNAIDHYHLDINWAYLVFFSERPIFGKIRYMNYAGCKRKFDIAKYTAKHGGKSYKYDPKKSKWGILSDSPRESSSQGKYPLNAKNCQLFSINVLSVLTIGLDDNLNGLFAHLPSLFYL